MRTRAARRAAILLVVLAALALPAAATAQECPRTTLAAVETEVMCPVCGTPLALASEAPQAQRQRALIERLIERCRSKEQIKAVMVAEFGDDVLALPDAEGFDLAAYLVPALAVLLAALAVALAALRWRRGGRGTDPSATTGDEDQATAHRLDADIGRYEL